jgi:hypothetical protein
MLATLAFGSVLCGVLLAAAGDRFVVKPFVARRLAGPVFVLGFVLLGVALSHWRFE